MTFPDTFFQGEYFDGFYVPPMMKRTWAAEMEVLARFDMICQEHELRYYIAYGTLLGAVRHKGFIPWDDDIDLWMPRADMMRLNALPEEVFAGQGILLINGYHDALTDNMAWKVDNGRTLMLSEEHLLQYHLCPFVVGLDLFPLDYVARDKEKLETQRVLFSSANTLCHKWDTEELTEQEKRDSYRKLEKMAGVKLDRNMPVKQRLMILTDIFLGMTGENEGDTVAHLPGRLAWMGGEGVDPAWFGEPVYLPFEQMSLPAPREYEKLLEMSYGKDYMTPLQQPAHGYPFYKGQYERLKNLFAEAGETLPAFFAE